MDGQGTTPLEGRKGAFGLAVILALGAALLYHLAGGPHLPSALPSVDAVRRTLLGSTIPYAALGYLCTTVAWIIWLWLACTLSLQVLLALAEILTRGARWVVQLRVIADAITLPAIRQLVHGTAVAVTVAQLTLRTLPVSAAPAPSLPVVATTSTHYSGAQTKAYPPTTQPAAGTAPTYTVQRGDSLWTIAERFYGDGEAWPRLIAANEGRRMPDGTVFPPNPVLQAGWILRIPDASDGAQETVQQTYVVHPGDTLSAIALRYYGDANAWPRIFNANRGAHLANGWTLTNPNLIWPGLVLTIPGVPSAVAAPVPKATVPQPTRPPVQQHEQEPTPTISHSIAPSPHLPKEATTSPAPTVVAPRQAAPASGSATVSPPAAGTGARYQPPAPSAFPTTPLRHSESAATSFGSLIAQAPPLLDALGLAGLAALGAGGVVVLTRRRRGFDVTSDHDAGVPIEEGFADAAASPTFARRLLGQPEPAVVVAEQVQHCLSQRGLGDLRILAVREGHRTFALTVEGSLASSQRLQTMASAIGEALGVRATARRTPEHDVILQLQRAARLRLVAPASAATTPALPLVALGILRTRDVLHVNWDMVQRLLIAGVVADETRATLTSVLTALAARHRPTELRLWMIGPAENVAAPLLAMPHTSRERRAEEGDAVRLLLGRLQGELDRQPSNPGRANAGDVRHLLVVTDLTRLTEEALLGLLDRAPANRLSVVAATNRPNDVTDNLLAEFTSRLVLGMPDEEASIRFSGSPDAAGLRPGRLLARLQGRPPLQLIAFHAADSYLERLVGEMRRVFCAEAADGTAPHRSSVAEDATTADSTSEEEPEEPHSGEVMVPATIELPNGFVIHPVAGGSDGDSILTHGAVTAVHVEGRDPVEPSVEKSTASLNLGTPQATATVSGSNRGGADAAPTESPDATAASTRADVPASNDPLHVTAATPTAPLLRVFCFGPLRVASGERDVSPMNQFQSWELLAYLATHRGPVDRDVLYCTFWPDVDEASAAHRLDMAVLRLKKVLTAQVGDAAREVICRERGSLSLNDRLICSDVRQFTAVYQQARQHPDAIELAELEEALALSGAELLADEDYPWLEQPGSDGLTLRERFERRIATVAMILAHRRERDGRPKEAMACYRQAIDRCPSLQDAVQGLYRCYGALGDLQGLLREHQRLQSLVGDVSEAGQSNHSRTNGEEETERVYRTMLAKLSKPATETVTGAQVPM